MSYIGYSHAEYHVAPPFIREVLVPDGSATYFDLANDVPGYQEDNIMVLVNHVVQEPLASYSIINDATNRPRRLNFGVALLSTDNLYVVHKGTGTLNITPATGSVTKLALADNLVSHVVDKFLGSQAAGNLTLTLSEAPINADSISVYVNGVYQRSVDNYTVSGSYLIFTSVLTNADQIDVHHHTIRSTVTKVADASIGTTQLTDLGVTSGKLDTNIAVAGTFGVTGAATLSNTCAITGNTTVGGTLGVTGNVTLTGNLIVNGTTTTINSTTLTVDDKNIEMGTVATPSDTTADGGGIILDMLCHWRYVLENIF